ncbi:MAG: DUF2007 domain-containing protein [Gemmatimonadota bacterium]
MSGSNAGWGGASGERDRPHVRIAEYLYRHEAEFAAGFLRDAGIPFRLQIDDAGGADAGVTIGRPAVIWVRADDEDEAREILDPDNDSDASVERVSAPDRATAPARREPRDAASSTRAPHGSRAPGTGPSRTPALEPLCRTERMVAGLLALALVGLASYGGEGAVPWVGVWETVALLMGLVLGLSAVSGKTLASLRAILRALSGTTP